MKLKIQDCSAKLAKDAVFDPYRYPPKMSIVPSFATNVSNGLEAGNPAEEAVPSLAHLGQYFCRLPDPLKLNVTAHESLLDPRRARWDLGVHLALYAPRRAFRPGERGG